MRPSPPPAAAPRTMRQDDLDAVIRLQSVCYGSEFHEPSAAFAAKQAAAPDSCWVILGDKGLLAYLVCLPIAGDKLPALHSPEWHSATNPDWLYLHDLAIHPEARGAGLAAAMLRKAIAFAQKHHLTSVGLIAVQDSVPFWRRHGFEPVADAQAWVSPAKLASFGKDATFMLRRNIA